MSAPERSSCLLAIATLFVAASGYGCQRSNDSPSPASPSVFISSAIREPGGPGSLSGLDLGCRTLRPDKPYLRKVVASFQTSTGQAVFRFGPRMLKVSAYDVFLGIQLPPDEFFETHFEVRNGTARLSAEPPAPVPPVIAVTEVSPASVTVNLGPDLVEFLENADSFAVHGGIGVGTRTHESPRGVLGEP